MKPSFPIWIPAGIVLLIGLEIAGALIVGFHHPAPPVPAQRSDPHQSPPPGYAIETNGKEWRWKTNFYEASHRETRAEALAAAWSQYLYEQDQKAHPWRLETPPPDPNAGLIPSFRTADHASDYRP